MKPEAVIFDLDGTLADTLPLCIFSFQEALERLTGNRPSESDVMKYFGYTEEGITQNMLPDNWQEYFDEYLEIYRSNHDMCPEPFDGIIEILDHLKNNNYKIAMVTGKGKHSADITLEKYNIKHYFEYVETGSSKGSIKPECISRILSNWNIEGHKVLYIGDSHTDIIDSKKSGVLPVAVSWASTANHNKLLEHEPYKIFSKIEDFKKWIIGM